MPKAALTASLSNQLSSIVRADLVNRSSTSRCCSRLRVAKRRPCRAPSSKVRSPSPTFGGRSEEHTSELQSLMRISYAVFCLNKKNYSTSLFLLSLLSFSLFFYHTFFT